MAPSRIQPLEPPYAPEVSRTLGRMMGGAEVEPLHLFRIVAHNPNVLEKMRSTGSYLLNFGTVDPLEREIVIHRTCARCGAEYEWGVHVAVYGRPLGLSSDQLYSTVHGSADDPVWNDRQALLVRLVDELHDTARITPDLWTTLAENWTPPQLVELVLLVGQYHGVSFLANAFAVPPEEFAEPFPARDVS
jgi:4-carboxymuconolactone decarboxylase